MDARRWKSWRRAALVRAAPWRRWWRRTFRPTLGQRGEAAAERLLRRQGLTIVARGLRQARGELDLVAVEDQTVVFVEVKTRASLDRGHPAEAVTPLKQRRIAREALAFVRRHRLGQYPLRFDVVAVIWPPGQRQPKLEHYRAAFEPPGRGQLAG